MANCIKCNSEINDGAKFCPFCGASQVVENSAVAVGAPIQNEIPQPVPTPVQSSIPPQPAPAPVQSSIPPQPAPAPVQNTIPPQSAYTAPVADPSDHTAEFDKADISENKVFAMVPYLLGFIGIIIALIASRDSKYVAFHVRQALKLEISIVLSSFLSIIPFLGWLATGVCCAIILVLTIIAFFQVCSGKAKEPAIIKNFAFLK
ncbi:MAG: zinc-ribbon domain-containing protein [Oscillospiraceae bacterium]